MSDQKFRSEQLYSPIFLKYIAEYDKNPKSRVFAPLAELYRKLGMHDKAMDILAKGIRFHPTYVMGYLGMAFCYFDLEQFSLAYSTLLPFVEVSRDNIRLQRLFADICIALKKNDEALDALKYLLFLNPKDKEVALLVTRFENEGVATEPQLNNTSKAAKKVVNEEKFEKSDDNYDQWQTVSLKEFSPPLSLSNEKLPTLKLELEPDHSPLPEVVETVVKKQTSPRSSISLALIDLYCHQGHFEKAIEVLEKMIELNPDDVEIENRLNEILRVIKAPPKEIAPEIELDLSSEVEDHKKLLELLPINKVKEEELELKIISKKEKKLINERKVIKLERFLSKIKSKALEYRVVF